MFPIRCILTLNISVTITNWIHVEMNFSIQNSLYNVILKLLFDIFSTNLNYL